MARVRVEERFAFSGGKVDRSGKYPVIRDVPLCGLTSENNRRYKPTAFAKVKYEGRPVFIDHTDASTGRKYRDHIGWVENERRREDGRPFGDIGIKPTHADAGNVLWDAENKPSNCGMSHVAKCETKRAADGWEEIESVEEVESVDIVIGPATTPGLAEQRGAGAVGQITVKEFAAKVGPKLGPQKWVALTKLLEDLGMGDSVSMDAPADDAGAEQSTEEAVDALGVAILKDTGLSDDEKLAKLKALFRAKKTILGSGDAGGDAPAEESHQAADTAATAVREAIEACRKVGFKGFDADDLDLIAAAPKARREAVAKRLMGSGSSPGEERPTSGDRSGVAGVRRESKQPDPPPSLVAGPLGWKR